MAPGGPGLHSIAKVTWDVILDRQEIISKRTTVEANRGFNSRELLQIFTQIKAEWTKQLSHINLPATCAIRPKHFMIRDAHLQTGVDTHANHITAPSRRDGCPTEGMEK